MAIMMNMVDTAQAAYERAVEKNVSPEAVQVAKEHLEAAQEEYDEFMRGGKAPEGDSRSATVH